MTLMTSDQTPTSNFGKLNINGLRINVDLIDGERLSGQYVLGDTSEEYKLKALLNKFINSEMKYLTELQMLRVVYFNQLDNCLGYQYILSKREKDLIFQNIKNFELISKTLINAIANSLETKKDKVHLKAEDVKMLVNSSDVRMLDLGVILNKHLFSNSQYIRNAIEFVSTDKFRKLLIKEKGECSGILFHRWFKESTLICDNLIQKSLIRVLDLPLARLHEYPSLLKNIVDSASKLYSQLQHNSIYVALMKLNQLIFRCAQPPRIASTWNDCVSVMGWVDADTKESPNIYLQQLESEFLEAHDMLLDFHVCTRSLYKCVQEYTERYCKYAELWYDTLDRGDSKVSVYTTPYESYLKLTALQRRAFKHVKRDFEEYIIPVFQACLDIAREVKIKITILRKISRDRDSQRDGHSQVGTVLENTLVQKLPALIKYTQQICFYIMLKIIRSLRDWWASGCCSQSQSHRQSY